MSIIAMMRDAAAVDTAKAVRPPARRPRGPAAPEEAADARTAADLARFIPTEALALYTAILPFLVPKDTPLSEQDFTSRWVLAIGVGILAVLFAVGVYKKAVEARGQPFRWPPRRTLTVVVAYAAWVCVIPGSPLNDFGWYTPSIGAIIGLVAATLLALVHLWFGKPEA
jgi:hypothetical protein